ncbi:efflux transporter outer membrane subunit [Algibacter mikhailovii]|uniref:Membrane protein n=1 Tax=Algibacter mikhailovii TaxID=425498 RepID=A0A918RCS4_9FLAO|nr:efflux transporter outer membrane subunit [Algibacter mikhailovii]GGZ92678.1 membrane protein [Algibacter mikhailovii]
MRRNKLYNFALIMVSILFVTSCKVGEDYVREEQNLPSSFRQDTSIDMSIANIPWWELFKDPVLVELVNTALINNKSINSALARLKESYLFYEIASADLYPSVNYGVGATTSTNSNTSDFSNSIGAGVTASYTVDLWHRIRSLNDAALQEFLATEEGNRALTINIITSMAVAYISLRDLDNRLLISEKTAKNFAENLDVMQARYDGGFVNEVDLTQSKIQLIEAEATIATLNRSRIQLENSISVLLGTTPKQIPRGLPLHEQIYLPEVPAGIPSELINRRPDILQAERQLQAQTIRIGIAEALKYPSLTISLNMGSQLLNPTSIFGELGAQLLGPIFNGGRIKKGVEIEKVRTEQLLYNYQLTYLTALKEVEDALIAQNTYNKEYILRKEQMELATKAAQLSWVRYDGGLTSYLEVLTLQESQFNSELRASSSLKQEILSIIELYQALGGGWSINNPN